MYENTGEVLGVATSAIVLPATASALTGINFFILLASFVAFLVVYNLIVKVIAKSLNKKS